MSGSGCFRQGFELKYDNTAQPPTLFLGNTSTEITYIYSDDTKVSIRTIGFNIMINQSLVEHSISWEFPVKDFTIANDSNLFVVGCDLKLDLFDLGANKLMGSCRTLCFKDTKIMENEADGSTCNGMGCCMIVTKTPTPFALMQQTEAITVPARLASAAIVTRVPAATLRSSGDADTDAATAVAARAVSTSAARTEEFLGRVVDESWLEVLGAARCGRAQGVTAQSLVAAEGVPERREVAEPERQEVAASSSVAAGAGSWRFLVPS
ncbi:hypothetical protein ABZP36_032774 [Zizania latifolia]